MPKGLVKYSPGLDKFTLSLPIFRVRDLIACQIEEMSHFQSECCLNVFHTSDVSF